MPDKGELPGRVRAGYGLGSVATGSFGTVPGLMLLPYLTDTLGITALLAGVIVFAPKAWDVILNPIAGRVSDRSVDPRGPRRPFLLRSGLALAVCFALLFAAPDLGSRWAGALWVLVAFVACATAYAFFQVPYIAMSAEITDSYHERTRLMGWRVSILAFAILVSGACAPAIRNAFGGRTGYQVMGVAIGVLLAIGALGAYAGTRHAPIGAVVTRPGTVRDQLRLVAGARDFRLLLGTFVVQAVATGAMLAGVDYMSRWVLGDKDLSTVLFVCFVGPALVCTPLWGVAGRRVGKRVGYAAASLVLAVAALVMVGARTLPHWSVFVATGLVGVGYAGVQVFPLAMLPDCAALDARRTGSNRIGVYTGVWTAGETLGLAIGPGVYALVLAIGGYVSSTSGDGVQPSSALTAITLGFSLVPGILVLLSLIPLQRYALTEQELQ